MRARLKSMLGWLLAALKVVRALFGLRDLFLFGGLACVARGLWLIYPPSAWIAVGAVLVMLALRGEERPPRQAE